MAEPLEPDYAPAPGARRAAPAHVELAAVGKQMQYSGLGSIFGSMQQTPGERQVKQATYAQIGQTAAENLRLRFFKKEADSVRKTRIQPLLDQLQAAKQEYDLATAITKTPYEEILYGAEGIAEAEAAAQSVARDGDPIPVEQGKTKDGGAKPKKLVPGAAQAAPNVVTEGGSLGGVSLKEGLTVRDTAGRPIFVDTEEGRAVLTNATSKFWADYQNINTQIMDVFSEYAGNPYVDSTMRKMAQETMRQAGYGVTGKLTPDEQVEAMQQRSIADEARATRALEREKLRQDVDQGYTNQIRQHAKMNEEALQANELGIFRDPPVQKEGESDDKFSARLMRWRAEGSAALTTHFAMRDRELQERSRSSLFTFDRQVVVDPKTAREDIKQSPLYSQYVDEAAVVPTQKLTNELIDVYNRFEGRPNELIAYLQDRFQGRLAPDSLRKLALLSPEEEDAQRLIQQLALQGGTLRKVQALASAKAMKQHFTNSMNSNARNSIISYLSDYRQSDQWDASYEAMLTVDPARLYAAIENEVVLEDLIDGMTVEDKRAYDDALERARRGARVEVPSGATDVSIFDNAESQARRQGLFGAGQTNTPVTEVTPPPVDPPASTPKKTNRSRSIMSGRGGSGNRDVGELFGFTGKGVGGRGPRRSNRSISGPSITMSGRGKSVTSEAVAEAPKLDKLSRDSNPGSTARSLQSEINELNKQIETIGRAVEAAGEGTVLRARYEGVLGDLQQRKSRKAKSLEAAAKSNSDVVQSVLRDVNSSLPKVN